MSKTTGGRKNPVARAVRSPAFRQRVVTDKRKDQSKKACRGPGVAKRDPLSPATFKRGNWVWWNDPDHGLLSGFYYIKSMCRERDDMILLSNSAGHEVEALPHEIKPAERQS